MTAFPEQRYAQFDTSLPEAVNVVSVIDVPDDSRALELALWDWQIRESGDRQTVEQALRNVLAEAGWPEDLHNQALSVAWCESRWITDALGIGETARGLFQIHLSPWFAYADEDPAEWSAALVNARVGWAVYQYDLSRGYAPWTQWECKP